MVFDELVEVLLPPVGVKVGYRVDEADVGDLDGTWHKIDEQGVRVDAEPACVRGEVLVIVGLGQSTG
jgi:hypothetical protein